MNKHYGCGWLHAPLRPSPPRKVKPKPVKEVENLEFLRDYCRRVGCAAGS